ncbi:MAG: chemotaxis protein CheB [Chitinophagaceae bacterium]|nr:chemotaxis protein CheB [Chitinophagaceae bacterium]
MPKYDIIIIGGSAGSIPVCISLLKALNNNNDIPVVLIIHRMRNVVSQLDMLLTREVGSVKITEPEDKQSITKGKIYLAPQNYHLLFEEDHSFSLDYSDPIHYSRPSIDVSFESAGRTYGHRVLAILLSGANSDGAEGLSYLTDIGASCIVQDPSSAQYPTMPSSAIALDKKIRIMNEEEMTTFLQEL